MNPYVFSASSLQQLETEIRGYIQKGFNPSLAIVFSAVTFNMEDILNSIKKYKMDVFGASTAGEITNGKMYQDTVSVMLLDLASQAYAINIFDRHGKSSFQTGREAGAWAKEKFDDPVMLVTSGGWDTDGDQLIEGIKSGADRSIMVYGGVAGNKLRQDMDTFAFGTAGIASNGIACLVFDRTCIQLSGITVGGWKGIGTKKIITKSTGNVVFHIDHQPVLEVYQRYLEVGSNFDLTRSNETGLLVERPDGSIVMRAALRINEDQSILYAGSMPEGAKVRFCISPGSEVVSQTVEQLKEFHEKVSRAETGILFSCVSRLQAIGSMVEKETMALSDIWKVPYNGFFTLGEFGPGNTGLSDFHNFTLSVVLIREK
jgi:hypothetical protein